jgi:hypothetical protein
LLQNTITQNWYAQLLVNIPKIKQFFSKSSKEQTKIIEASANQEEWDLELIQFDRREVAMTGEDYLDDTGKSLICLGQN